ncbi:MAG: transketolase C-terminal domain-containing protein [Chloroflexota bacterium]|nr:transketolase C-terminal domain-containing protein [Chloroflexota bacterium]
MGDDNSRTLIITGNEAAAIGARLSRVQVIAAYPITPQSPVTENLSQYVEKGELDAQYVAVESEHSALSVCIGASSVGARAFTATSANGLAYMCEQIHWAAGARLPLVMCCVNRAMAAPWNVLNDQQDSMSQRDAGWVQLFARDNQEILDLVIQAYKIAETAYVPVMVCYDGYILSHTVMPVDVPTQDDVDRFLPSYTPHTILNPDNPRNLNQVTLADPRVNSSGVLCHGYLEFRYMLEEALHDTMQIISDTNREFTSVFGRNRGDLIWNYELDDADVALLAAGSIATQATVAADELRTQGVKAGVIGIRSYRPFPKEALMEATSKTKLVIVFDKSLSYGNEGPICSDLKSALYFSEMRPMVHGYVAGLGGRDIKARELVEATYSSIEWLKSGESIKTTGWINCQI